MIIIIISVDGMVCECNCNIDAHIDIKLNLQDDPLTSASQREKVSAANKCDNKN